MKHELKTWPRYFQMTVDGKKSFELRKNDRDFAVGDILHLREWIPETREYTGRTFDTSIISLLGNTVFGLQAGYCIIGTKPAPDLREAEIATLQKQLAEAKEFLQIPVEIRNEVSVAAIITANEVLKKQLAEAKAEIARLIALKGNAQPEKG